MRLKGKVAIVTGSASGAGRATAITFARHGAKVIVADIQDEKGQETADYINANGGTALYQHTNVVEVDDIKRLFKRATDEWGRIDILFNNAGIAHPIKSIEEISEDVFDRTMMVNVKSVFLGIKYVAPIMKRQNGGCIINTASIAAVKPRHGHNAYAASKGAVISLTRAMASELASYKIRVNCINPVAIDTPMISEFIPGKDPDQTRKDLSASIPLGRLAKPEDIANGALFLASEEADLVTGIELNVDGGRAL